jgi:hypothetical protein
MPSPSDALAWIPESELLSLCGIPRSTLQSWVKSGFDLELSGRRAAYGLPEVVTVLVLSKVREYLAPKKMFTAWRELVSSGEADRIVSAAVVLRGSTSDEDAFDIVVDAKYSMFSVCLSDAELLATVRDAGDPRSLVVVDALDAVRKTVGAFGRAANTTPRPSSRKAGRPANAFRQRYAAGDA